VSVAPWGGGGGGGGPDDGSDGRAAGCGEDLVSIRN